MGAQVPWRETEDGLVLFLRVTPNAGATRIDGIEMRDDGNAVLRVRVTAVPDRGKANKAVIALVAKTLDVPKSAITLIAGETARMKTVRISAASGALAAKLASL